MKVPYHNDTDKFVHIGPVTIAPGATRDVEDSHIPGHKPAADTAPEAAADPLALLSAGKVADIIAQIPSLSDADLDRLGEMEQVGKNRTTLLSAIAEALLHRAAMSDMLAKVAALSAEELAAEFKDIGTDVNADPDYLAALEAEQAKRAAE